MQIIESTAPNWDSSYVEKLTSSKQKHHIDKKESCNHQHTGTNTSNITNLRRQRPLPPSKKLKILPKTSTIKPRTNSKGEKQRKKSNKSDISRIMN